MKHGKKVQLTVKIDSEIDREFRITLAELEMSKKGDLSPAVEQALLCFIKCVKKDVCRKSDIKLFKKTT